MPMRLITLSLPSGGAIIINADNIVSIRDAMGDEIDDNINTKVVTVSDFHFVRDNVADIFTTLEALP